MKLARGLFKEQRHDRRNEPWTSAWIMREAFAGQAVRNDNTIRRICLAVLPFTHLTSD